MRVNEGLSLKIVDVKLRTLRPGGARVGSQRRSRFLPIVGGKISFRLPFGVSPEHAFDGGLDFGTDKTYL